MIEISTEGVNYIRGILRKKNDFGNKDFHNFSINMISSSYLTEVINKLKYISTGKRYNPKMLDLGGHKVPYFLDFVMHIITEEYFITQKEALTLSKNIQKKGIDSIPILKIQSSLEAVTSNRQNNESVSNTMDIMRISSILPYADIFITDKAKVNDIKQLGYDKKYQTKIFSGKKDDLDNLILLLKKIVY